jgi:Membrane proteins related to metalloendopeptidases
MHSFFHRFIVVAAFTVLSAPTSLYASFQKKDEAKAPVAIPLIRTETPRTHTPTYRLTKSLFERRIKILPLDDNIRSIEFSEMPEEYDIWSNVDINPYQVNLTDMRDTLRIDLSSYYPPSKKYVTSEFGFRRALFHYGIDLKVHRGDSVYNAFDGVVRVTRRASGYGYIVIMRHFNGLETLYGHLNKITVSPGDTLKAGMPIGLGGNTGRSTGYHLHFEVRYLGNPINPRDIIDFDNFIVKNSILYLSAQNFEYKKEVDKIRYWTVRSGDTLSRIASRTGISISRLCSLNGITKTSILRIGQRIRYT